MQKLIYIFVTFLFILAGYFSINRLLVKPGLPFDFYSENSGIYFDDYESLPGKYKLISIDGFVINNEFRLEFYLDSKSIGDIVSFQCTNSSGTVVKEQVSLTAYYRNPAFPLISGFIGYLFLLLALFVILKRARGNQAVYLYWILAFFGTAALTSPGHYNISGDMIAYFIRTLHALSYSAGGLFFVFFILVFPLDKLKERKTALIILSVLTLVAALFASTAQIISINNINSVPVFDVSWDIVQALLIILLAYGTFEVVRTLKSLTNREDKLKTGWIIWGLTVGVLPYIIFWVIPQILRLPIIIKEEYLLAFLIFVPVSFVIAVIKYEVMDIELVVKRSFVYSLLSLVILGIYSALIYLASWLSSFILGPEMKYLDLLAVLISALLFNPLRSRLNKFADRVFYREKYVFDEALKEVMSRIKECITTGSLGKLLITEIEKFIPVNAIAIVIRKSGEDRLKVLEQKNFDELSNNIQALRLKRLTSDFKLPFAVEKKIEKGISIDKSMEQALNRWEVNIAVPLVAEPNEATGAIVLGDKLSGLKYSASDIDLLNVIALSAALALKRLELVEKLALEELEISKLEELNKLKSFYVASVSHDLKTPLTSVKVFTELMLSEKKIPDDKRNEYLRIINSETDRLTRLIDNVLDFAKIEKGIKQYSFTEINLNDVLKEAVSSLEHYLELTKFKYEVKCTENKIRINGDADAIKSALFNIIANSIKYSQNNKCISIISGLQSSWAFIEIEDKGIGIPKSDQELIFDPFFRSSQDQTKPVKGAGLGLAIVKHVMDAHRGKIELKSTLNIGTKIRLIFPLE